eukprot:3096474-Karenia_brevis.AAC.1
MRPGLVVKDVLDWQESVNGPEMVLLHPFQNNCIPLLAGMRSSMHLSARGTIKIRRQGHVQVRS